jgi:heat shock protein HslJ
MTVSLAALLGAITLAAGDAAPAAPAGGWLDAAVPLAWNAAGGRVPRAPGEEPDALLAERCKGLLRAPHSAADRAVAAAGWQLFGALQRHGETEVVLGQAGVDGMCRPRAYQVFVFSGGRFAGTLSPRPMDSRTDGSAQIPHLTSADRLFVVFSRYAPQDPLCCPSRLTTVEYRIDPGPKGPVVVPASARTERAASGAPPAPVTSPAQAPDADPHAAPGGTCAPEPGAASCDATPANTSPISMRVWHLVRIRRPDGPPLVPETPSRYTLELGRDGRALVRADCNRASCPYRLERESLGFGPLAGTRAACPPGSLSDRYLQELGLVDSWSEKDGRLFLATRADGASLELQPAPGPFGVLSGTERCMRAGGTVETASCCKLVGDFPNTCLVGACGCAPGQSHAVQACRCPAGQCFDGRLCVEARGAPGQLR